MRSLIWLGIVAIVVTGAGAVAGQAPGRPASAGIVTVLAQRARISLQPTAVLNRILSFDANGDDRISRDELPERMEGLVSRGDRNQDGFLTSDEIVPLVDLQPSARRQPFGVNVRGSGSLADIIADLKLPPDTHDRALAIVNRPPNVFDPANVDFKAEMKDLLDDEDYENYVAAAARFRRTPRIISGNIGGVVRDPAMPPR